MAGEALFGSMNEVRAVFDEAALAAERTGVKIKIPHLSGEDPAGDEAHKPCHTAWRDFFLGSDGWTRPCMSTPVKLLHIDEDPDYSAMWNSKANRDVRAAVNNADAMSGSCRYCYQSSFANWNKKTSFYQFGKEFSPEWGSVTPPRQTRQCRKITAGRSFIEGFSRDLCAA
jgi:hypothetical protein